MNSQMKDALNEFISSNSSAIEQAMENGNHGKDEPVIQDLVNYLSCPTPQSCHEGSQTMLVEDKIPTHKSNFNSSSLEAAHLAQINSCELQNSHQYNTGQMCVSTSTTNYTVGTPGQQFHQQTNSYKQDTLYPDSLKQSSCTNSDFQDMHLENSSTCDGSRGQEKNHSSPKIGVGENQYFHNGQSDQFHCPSDVDRHYQHTMENQLKQFSSTDNGVVQFENNSQANTSDFKNTSALSSSFTSSNNSQVHYGSGQGSLGYDLMDVIQVPAGNLETNANQFKAQEKMHVDEPEAQFDQSNSTASNSQLEAVLAGFVEAHMQSYNSDGFSAKSSLDNDQDSTANSNCVFTQSLTDDSTSHSAPNSEAASASTINSSPAFDLNRSLYQQSPLPSSFINQNFQQSPALPMSSPAEPSPSSDFQTQPSPCQVGSVNSDSTHYISWHSGSLSMSTNSSPYQDGHYQDSTVHSQTPANIPDSFQMSSTISQSQEFNQEHRLHQHQSFDSSLYQHSQGSHQPSLLDHNQFKQNSVVSSDYCNDSMTVHSPDQHPGGYMSSESSPINISAPFSSSLPAGNLNQQQSYLTSPLPQSSSQPNDQSDFISYSSSERATLIADIASVNQACASQSIADYVDSSSSDHRQVLADTNKASPDVTMGEFQSGGNAGTFSQLAFNGETGTSTSLQNTSCLNTVSDPPAYDGYEYCNMASVSANFTQSTNSTADANTQFSFNQQNQSITDVNLYNPAGITSFATDVCDQSTTHQYGSSTFSLHSISQVANENYPQPMHVQDSEFASKIAEFGNESTTRNTETAMEISSSLMEKRDSLPSCISYEEIHMSIVKAGNALSNNLHETNAHPHVLSDSSSALAGNTEASGTFSDLHSSPDIGIFQAEVSHTNSVSYNAAPEDPLAQTSEAVARQDSLSSNGASYALSNSSSVLTSFSNGNSDHSLISSILNNLQMPNAPSSHLLLQEQLNKQPDMTVPNFLENPETLMACSHTSNIDNMSFTPPSDITQGHLDTQFGVAMNASSPASSSTVVSGTGINQPILAEVTDTCITSSQHTILNQEVPLVTSMTQSPQVFSSINTLPWPSNTSFLSQSDIGLVDHTSVSVSSLSTSQAMPALIPKLAGASVTDSASSSEVFLQLAPPLSDSKNSSLPNAVSDAMNNILHGPKPSVITSETISAGNPSSTLTSLSGEQPQIFVSLDDLQKLLAQQNLSHSSPSLHQQQSHVAVASSQTLVLQKHASHSLRQSQPRLSQPRLLIKGATLPSSSRVIHPHQQILQTRDKLQLMVHQTSEHISTGTLFPNNLDNTAVCTTQEIQQKLPNSFQLSSVNRDQHHAQQKLLQLQQTQTTEQQQQVKLQLQLKQTQVQQQQQQAVNLFIQQLSKSNEQKATSLHLFGYQQLDQQQTGQKHAKNELHLQQIQNGIQLSQMQQELQQLQKQQDSDQDQKEQQLKQLHNHHQHLQPVEILERLDRPSSESLKKDYKHLHSLLTGDTTGLSSHDTTTQAKALPSALNLPCGLQGQPSQHFLNGLSGKSAQVTPVHPLLSATQTLAAPFSFLPMNNFSTSPQTNITQPSAPLTTLAFLKTSTTSNLSKSFDTSESTIEIASINSQPHLFHVHNSVKLEDNSSDKKEQDIGGDCFSNRHTSILAQILTERKRCHTPLSVDLNSPANSSSGAGSPLSSPTPFEDGSTQLTLIERSAGLQIKSDTMHGLDDGDDENAIFDLNSFHKRPSTNEFHSAREQNGSVPIKIAKPSINADAHSSVNTPMSPEPKFDFGSVVTSATNFFTFGKKEDNNSEVYTFGTVTSACDSPQYKDGSKHYRPNSSKQTTKAVGMRSVVPTQPVRPTSHKQKEYSLKASYPSKVDSMELKIVKQPEPQHRARYQTEGSRGAIKDASQLGFPVIKLMGYSRATKLQVFIGDECSRVKPHGFYQVCRVFGKSSTSCIEHEIEGTTVVEIEMLPENDMTVKLDCIGILKLRNADVERRIGPKRARDKKRTNIRARLVMRCVVEKCDGSQHLLQVVSNPIVCTQPVGQPEISRMSLSESNVCGGESLFIIGKNFRNKGTSVLFQKLDSNDDSLLWQAEAEIEQEFFQPTHLICKVPPYKDQTIESPFVAQIVVSCAGKKSDPLGFIYKPVYQVAMSMKMEFAGEADMAVSTRPLPFVSPEALHLNRMVQQSQAQSSTTSTMFQLPPGTIPGMHSITANPSLATAVHTDPTPTQANMSLNMTAVSSSSSMTSASMTLPGQALPTFLLEEKHDGLVQKLSKPSETAHLPASAPSRTMVNCIVHSNSNTNAVSPTSYAVSDSHPQPSLTSSSGAGHTKRIDTPSSVTNSFPSTPFFVVVDPTALQTSVGGDKIQELLLQILEAQSKI